MASMHRVHRTGLKILRLNVYALWESRLGADCAAIGAAGGDAVLL